MNPQLAELLRTWGDFHTLIGASAATLIGLMFMAASIGAGVFTRAHQMGIRSFLSPTVAHFSAVLFVSLFAAMPIQSWNSFGVLLILVGLIGLGYALFIWRRMVRHGLIGTIDIVDRLWYVLLPIAGYLLIVAAGVGLCERDATGLAVLAAAVILLMLIGIRSAWDMTVWIIDRRQG